MGSKSAPERAAGHGRAYSATASVSQAPSVANHWRLLITQTCWAFARWTWNQVEGSLRAMTITVSPTANLPSRVALVAGPDR